MVGLGQFLARGLTKGQVYGWARTGCKSVVLSCYSGITLVFLFSVLVLVLVLLHGYTVE
jgi:hypothetical protein